MSTTRSTPQRMTRRSTRSPPVSSSNQFNTFTTALNRTSNTPQKPTRTNESIIKKQETQSNKPTLPIDKKNSLLDRGRVRSVKTQLIPLENNWSITIARVKVPTTSGVSGHLIKRFDTNAISASSFFRAAFPDASVEDEQAHMSYFTDVYDTATAGGDHIGPECKLTGTWVPVAHAESIAEWYGLSKFAADLITFPDPNNGSASPMDPKTGLKQSESSQVTNSDPPQAAESTPVPKMVGTPGTRSIKRPRVAPPSFGNTSPSHFSLSAASVSATSNEAPGIDQSATIDEADPTEESMFISNDEGEEPEQTSLQVTVTQTSMNNRIDEGMTTTTTATACVIGTDEQVELAKRDALNLVASLQESAAAQNHSSNEWSQKKRGLEQTEPIITTTRDTDEETVLAAPPPRGLFARFWSRKANAKKREEMAKTLNKQSREIASLPTHPVVPPVTSVTKRNLAVAGIVVAGAAASIAPYFF
ncbi:uncharacterized protein MELLADRAFT_117186 [Melampsora larici-populina 98AG31]|uniref:HTH APSES-type domain-containing protein n=1 Tax=Melampsora larici-populina (strain 98AG31 / pathotype 3-4-7) TaxID=747676 RepID=F4RUC8_MELLP|nr:uncharacterized protein MELLADRAFT_117186 [Melampsora larici-populina 98AG31]EGG03912.1 hypothetical protein MELLADRAFT_117186 [Melampsora larici-populina 98AG31]